MAKSAKTPKEIPLVSDDDVIDLVMKVLYSDTSREFDLEKEILKPTKLKYTHSDFDRIWKLLLETNMVEQAIGFGKAGMIELSANGLLIMNRYGGYLEYVNQHTQLPEAVNVQEVTPEETKKKPITKIKNPRGRRPKKKS